jgi:hypothetical protein
VNENAHNRADGTITSVAVMKELRELCDAHDLALHVDGARIFNASVALDIPARNSSWTLFGAACRARPEPPFRLDRRLEAELLSGERVGSHVHPCPERPAQQSLYVTLRAPGCSVR